MYLVGTVKRRMAQEPMKNTITNPSKIHAYTTKAMGSVKESLGKLTGSEKLQQDGCHDKLMAEEEFKIIAEKSGRMDQWPPVDPSTINPASVITYP